MRALVTGASSGIGRCTALTLAENGFAVVATVRGTQATDELLGAAADASLPLDVRTLDVRDRATSAALVADLAGRGGVQILVNNAGVGSMGSVEYTGDDEVDVVMDTNFRSVVALTRLVLPGMRRAGKGVVVTIGSVDGLLPGRPMRWLYAASKHAVGTFSEALALEVADAGIRVRQLDPGFHATRIRQNRVDRTDGQDPIGEPYRWLHARVEAAMRAGDSAGGDPQQVADAVLEAVLDPAVHPVRRVVGADADAAIVQATGVDEAELAGLWWDEIGLARRR